MRDNNLREAVLYLNIPPCGKDEAEKRCHVNLEKIVPAGSTLWVGDISETGAMTRHKYEGTGEAIT